MVPEIIIQTTVGQDVADSTNKNRKKHCLPLWSRGYSNKDSKGKSNVLEKGSPTPVHQSGGRPASARRSLSPSSMYCFMWKDYIRIDATHRRALSPYTRCTARLTSNPSEGSHGLDRCLWVGRQLVIQLTKRNSRNLRSFAKYNALLS
ncbi:hypothetical protein J6590_092983 [Homalodisca vitripennis]|nr:hypothetical protein J6590_092983 [Homalodisca vitripennis]